MKNKNLRVNQLIFLLVIITLSLACNTLGYIDPNIKIASEIEEQLQEGGMIILSDVVSAKDIITVTIEMLKNESPYGAYSTWVYIYEQVLQKAPGVKVVIINMHYLGESYGSITAHAENIKLLLNQEIDPITFIDRLEIHDERLPQTRLQHELTALNWIISNVQISKASVDIEGFPPEADTHDQVLSHWIEAMRLAADFAPESDQINLHVLLIGQPNMTVSVRMEDLKAYQNGEMDAINFLASMSVSE